MKIEKPITEDGCVGWDEFGQLVCTVKEPGFGRDARVSFLIHDTRGKTCLICNRGWEPNAQAMSDQHFWRQRDVLVHDSCFYRYLGLIEFRTVYGALLDARIRFEKIETVPNRYWGKGPGYGTDRHIALGCPWYKVDIRDDDRQTPFRLVIGMRKRVWEIVLTRSDDQPIAHWPVLEEVFQKEDVTKSFTPNQCLIHAWGDQKLNEYVLAIAKALDLAR